LPLYIYTSPSFLLAPGSNLRTKHTQRPLPPPLRRPMTMGNILHNFSAMLVTCREQVSRVARCLKKRVSRLSKNSKHHRRMIKKMSSKEGQEGKAIWRNTILMGEKCRPLNFSGVIHYDSDGRLTSIPRSPIRSPLPYTHLRKSK
jgi:hypothetical protein